MCVEGRGGGVASDIILVISARHCRPRSMCTAPDLTGCSLSLRVACCQALAELQQAEAGLRARPLTRPTNISIFSTRATKSSLAAESPDTALTRDGRWRAAARPVRRASNPGGREGVKKCAARRARLSGAHDFYFPPDSAKKPNVNFFHV